MTTENTSNETYHWEVTSKCQFLDKLLVPKSPTFW